MIANIVPVPKKDGKVRMCVDYRDLNKACPKDDFPLPHIDLLVDRMAGHEMVSLTDLAVGYNQIMMHLPDKEKTAFITEWGTYCYRVMPFGLKNAGATYQRMATTIFHDMIHKEVEVYVDDMVVKSKTAEEHTTALEKFFLRLRKYNLKLNPAKCLFGATSGVFLGHMVSRKGIEIDPSKAKAILEMPAPKTKKEVRGFLGRLQYISRFINQLADTCGPIFKLLRKGVSVKWNEDCQKAFDQVKQYLLSPPVLQPPRPGKPLLLYLSVTEEAMGAMLAQQAEDTRVENAVYYLSKRMLDYELKYNKIEKLCLALVWACTKLQHYLSSYTTYVISESNPLKFLMERPALDSKMAKGYQCSQPMT